MKVKCPQCKKELQYSSENPFRPFCSKQCQLIDLGDWADENHTIPAKPEVMDEFEIDPELIEEMLKKHLDS